MTTATAVGVGLGARRVSKTFETRRGEIHAIRDLSVEIEAGQFVAVVGRSGCGKSTLLRLFSGLLEPSAGELVVGERVVTGPPDEARYVFQDYGQSLLPWKSVDDNLRFGIRHAVDRAAVDPADDIAAFLRLVGLHGVGARYPWELSGGMQQRLAIARALIARPRVLLMDEAFSSVDALSRANLQDLVLDLWGDLDLTIVFVTHDIDEAVYLADRVVVLDPHGNGVLADVAVDVPRPRHQVETREHPHFLRARRRLLELVLD